MIGSQTGNWCIFYRKLSEPTKWYTMKLRRSDGIIVSAKTYEDVYKFGRYKEAFDFVKNLITEEPSPKYDAVVKRVCRQRGEGFYLSGN